MASKWIWTLAFGMVSLSLAGPRAHAGDEALQKELLALNRITGAASRLAAIDAITANKDHAKKLIEFGLPAAQKKQLSYDAAYVLALSAADLKDLKASETFFRVCMTQAAKLQSFDRLRESYVMLIGIYYDDKHYADAARICKELLELNTDDGKDRIVIATMTNRFGDVEFREEQEGFNTPAPLRPFVREIRIKAIAKQGKYDQAIKLVDDLLKNKMDWADQYLKGWVLHEAGKLADSASMYEDVIKAVAKDTNFSKQARDKYVDQLHYEISNVYIELKKINQATEHLEILLKKHPNNPSFANDLGYIWADNNQKLDEAEKLIRKAIDLDRENRKKKKGYDPKTDHDPGAYLDSLGWVLHRQKKNEEAKDWLIKALSDKGAQHIEIYDHLADVYMALGQRDLAVKAWQDGLKHVNDNRRDRERKAEVERKLAKVKSSK